MHQGTGLVAPRQISLRAQTTLLRSRRGGGDQLYIVQSRDEKKPGMAVQFADVLKANAPKDLDWAFVSMPSKTQATVYEPAALQAFRKLFKPAK